MTERIKAPKTKRVFVVGATLHAASYTCAHFLKSCWPEPQTLITWKPYLRDTLIHWNPNFACLICHDITCQSSEEEEQQEDSVCCWSDVQAEYEETCRGFASMVMLGICLRTRRRSGKLQKKHCKKKKWKHFSVNSIWREEGRGYGMVIEICR
jgi:hypothetical protein